MTSIETNTDMCELLERLCSELHGIGVSLSKITTKLDTLADLQNETNERLGDLKAEVEDMKKETCELLDSIDGGVDACFNTIPTL